MIDSKKKLILIILDGWGIQTNKQISAISKANTPFYDYLLENYSNSQLITSGNYVGLPKNTVGNSEVGHLNIGAGRIVQQDLLKINKAIANKTIDNNETIIAAFDYALKHNKPIHIIGLLSDGGVHSHIDHIKYLCSMAFDKKVKNIYIHAFTDGRDTDCHSAISYINDLQKHLYKTTGKIATIIGRYYAMDRDKKWERIKKAYDALINGKGIITDNWEKEIQKSYIQGISDEFIKPIKIKNNNEKITNINNGDVVISANFRSDRVKQLTQVLTQKAITEEKLIPLNLKYVTFTNYSNNFKNIDVIFKKDLLKNTLGEVLSKNKIHQLRVAETEKYPHITYFFSGGREKPFNFEKRILCQSPMVATYDLDPKMSATKITNETTKQIIKEKFGFVCINFANADMVGHTGNMQATVSACETIDQCLAKLIPKALESNYTLMIISDHGNADEMLNEKGTPITAHSKNPVPCIFISNDRHLKIKNGILSDIAPTILDFMNLKIPNEMTGKILLHKN